MQKKENEDREAGDRLRGRILAAFPAGHYALDAFFRLADVVVTDQVDTAAVECVALPKLLVNGEFVAKHCKTDEHLFILVMHELHHILLGHTRLFKRHTLLDNIAFDAVINAILCQLFRQPLYFSFFQNLYRADKVPDALLRPPEGWPDRMRIPASLPKGVAGMIRTLYSEASGTYKEVYDLLKNDQAVANALAKALAGGAPVLLGDHSPEDTPSRGEQAANNPALNGAVRSIVEKWPMPPDPIRGRSVGRDLRELLLGQVATPLSARKVLEALVRKSIIDTDKGGVARKRLRQNNRTIENPVPTLRDRRAFVSASLGWQPLIYRSTLSTTSVVRETGASSVYVDVSGSVASYREILASLVRPYVERGLVRLFVFSELVEEVSPQNLRRGKYSTTDGTDAGCIWKHASENDFRKIVILTDGYVGAPGRHWQAKLSELGLRIRVALTPNGYLPDLEGVAEEIVDLPLTQPLERRTQ